MEIQCASFILCFTQKCCHGYINSLGPSKRFCFRLCPTFGECSRDLRGSILRAKHRRVNKLVSYDTTHTTGVSRDSKRCTGWHFELFSFSHMTNHKFTFSFILSLFKLYYYV